MAIEIQTLVRTFTFNNVPLADPGDEFTAEEVKEMYSAQYPDLISALVQGPVMKDDVATYTFVRNVGTKG